MADKSKTGPSSDVPATPKDFLKSLLRGQEAEWPTQWGREWADSLLQECQIQGVGSLIFHLQDTRSWQGWPQRMVDELRRRERGALLLESLLQQKLRSTLGYLADGGIKALVLKGSGLAYLAYPAPHLRPRQDTDLLIRKSDFARACRLLESRGYQQAPGVTGESILSQRSFFREDPNGFRHVFDIHWRISNVQIFRDVFTFEELAARALPLPGLDPAAFTLGTADHLLHAAIHRLAHHGGSNRLIWLYDIRLLSGALESEEAGQFTARAQAKMVAAVCRDGIRAAWHHLGRPEVPEEFRQWCLGESSVPEATAGFITRGHQRHYIFWSDFRWAPGWGAKLNLAREHLFPPRSYMYQKYSTRNPLLLPWLYARRAVEGVWKMVRG